MGDGLNSQEELKAPGELTLREKGREVIMCPVPAGCLAFWALGVHKFRRHVGPRTPLSFPLPTLSTLRGTPRQADLTPE